MSSSPVVPKANAASYSYDQLPNTNFIRLLTFEPCSGQSISLSLTTHILELAPEFDCLSYTWGNPTSAYSEAAEISNIVYQSTGEIGLDGCEFSVQYNLYDALEMLSNLSSSERSRYVWIDAICINQQSLEERAAQVAIMDKIYSKARRVIAWLGQENEFTQDAISLLRIIGRVPEERYKHIRVSHWQNHDLEFLRMGVSPPPTFNQWLGLIALFNLPYMRRVWIIQEVLVARDVMVVWGSENFPWTLIAKVMSFFVTTGWHFYITTLHFKSLPVVVENAGVYTQMLREKSLDINLVLEQIRREIVRDGAPPALPKLVSMFRDSKASDPRDKIYALLNLANKESPPFRMYPEALVADYTISTRELFIKVTRIFLKAYPNLRNLFLIEDAALRQIHDLPSWVPDYTVPMRPVSLSHRGYFKYNASKGIERLDEQGDLKSDSFAVAGFCFSEITTLVDQFRGDDPWTDSLESNQHWVKIFQLAIDITDEQLKTSDPSVGRAEVLWRTLCGNNINAQYPAPKLTNSIFFKWLCICVVARQFVWEENLDPMNPVTSIGGKKKWEELLEPIRRLLELEPAGSEFQLSAFETLLGDMILSTNYWRDFDLFKPVYMDWWSSVMAHHNGTRRHFQDSTHRFGMGPGSMEIGDEIWIIGGCPTPCFLRPVTKGKYRLIGEAYIYGIMDGELADHGDLKNVEQILLI